MNEKKQGRPPVPPELKARSRTIILNENQWKELLRQASEKHLSRSEYLIYKLNLNKKP